MAKEIRTIRAAALEALGSFRWREFAPFGWLLAVELVVLFLGMNLGTAWGMATVGWLTERIAGDAPLHYPDFYAFLPTLITNMEAVLFALPGCFLIPLAVIRVLRPIDPASFPPGTTGSRVRQAAIPVLVGALACEVLIVGWQWALHQRAVIGAIRSVARGGIPGAAAVAIIGLLVGYAIWTLFVYIPAAAVQPGRKPGVALRDGIREAASNFFPTYLVVIGLSLPAAAILLVLQVMGSFLVRQIRPEIVAVLIGMYVVFSMLATFFIYAAGARFYQARRVEPSS